MHKPVVVLAAGHSAPSGAPAEQTTETNTSSSLQPTFLSPLTIRKPVTPAGPGGPIDPGERRASEALLKKQAKGSKRITVGEDKAYDTSDHIAALRRMITLCPAASTLLA